jgi:hypothetical protein
MLAIPIADYPSDKKALPDSTFDNYPPYWTSKYQVSFVNLPSLIDYVESLRSSNKHDMIFCPPGVVAKYVVYKEDDLTMQLNPLNVDSDHEGDFEWTPAVGYKKVSLPEYIDLLEVKHPYIATDYQFNPYWNFWEPPKEIWSFDSPPKSKLKEGWPENKIAVMALKTWLTYTGILIYDIEKKPTVLPPKIIWD